MLRTARLTLRPWSPADAALLLALFTDPDSVRHVGDRGVHSEDGARAYIERHFLPAYEAHGYGAYVVELADDGAPIGTCGLFHRPGLDDPDIGYAFLPAYRGRGYAREAAAAVLAHASGPLGLPRVAAYAAPGNAPSIRVLESIGLRRVGTRRLPGTATDSVVFVFTRDQVKPG